MTNTPSPHPQRTADKHKARQALTLAMTGVSAATVLDVLIGHELARRGLELGEAEHLELVGGIAACVDDELRGLELAARAPLAAAPRAAS